MAPHLLEETLDILKAFSASVKTDKMAQSLKEYQCNWITLAPFVDIFFAPIHHPSNKPSSHSDEVRSTCTQVSVLALTVEMSRLCDRQLAVKQGLLDCLVCLPWVVENKWCSEVYAAVKLLKDDSSHLPVPTLHSLAAVSLAKNGLFSIRDIF